MAIGSVLRLVECLSGLDPEDVTDPAPLCDCQCTEELDNMQFPIRRKSTQREPAPWRGLLAHGGDFWSLGLKRMN